MTARKIGRISLEEALQLTELAAKRAPDRFARFSARFFERYLEERPGATPAQIALLATALQGLSDPEARAASQAALDGLVVEERTQKPPIERA